MCVLYELASSHKSDAMFPNLPTEYELSTADRMQVEFTRLECLLPQFPADGDHSLAGLASSLSDALDKGSDVLRAELLKVNLEILKVFACVSQQLKIAYELGRSLRVTANPQPFNAQETSHPDSVIAFALHRGRIEKLQQQLGEIGGNLPPGSAPLIGASLGQWGAWGAIAFREHFPRYRRHNRRENTDLTRRTKQALRNQGDVWINLATGDQLADTPLTPEGTVLAAEAALSRTARILRRLVAHYWFVIVIALAIVGGIFYLTSLYIGGAGKVWTDLGTVASTLGLTAKSVASKIGSFSEASERPIYRAEKLDALATQFTHLPTVKLTNRGVRALRRSGIQRPRSLARI